MKKQMNESTTFTVSADETEFIVAAMQELQIDNYVVKKELNKTTIHADISHRTFKKVKRIAWVLRLSKETGVRHVCRDEIHMNISGVIPKQEEYFFMKNVM